MACKTTLEKGYNMTFREFAAVTIGAAMIALAPLAQAHFDDKQMAQSYRQSWFALLANNFGPMAATVKGEIPWNDEQMQIWARDFAAVSQLRLMRGFVAGSEQGTTRAKPEIWDNLDDFESKLGDLRDAAIALETAVNGGDRKVIATSVGETGEACKACHDEYKSKDYIY